MITVKDTLEQLQWMIDRARLGGIISLNMEEDLSVSQEPMVGTITVDYYVPKTITKPEVGE